MIAVPFIVATSCITRTRAFNRCPFGIPRGWQRQVSNHLLGASAALSTALGGATGGLGVALVGLPNVFFFPAAFSAVAVIGLAAMARSSELK